MIVHGVVGYACHCTRHAACSTYHSARVMWMWTCIRIALHHSCPYPTMASDRHAGTCSRHLLQLQQCPVPPAVAAAAAACTRSDADVHVSLMPITHPPCSTCSTARTRLTPSSVSPNRTALAAHQRQRQKKKTLTTTTCQTWSRTSKRPPLHKQRAAVVTSLR